MDNAWEKKILIRIKTRLGIETSDTKKDELLRDYIKDSFVEIVRYTHSNSYDLSYDSKLIQCVVFLYNKRGVEGVVSRNANGISDNFDTALEIAPILATMPQNIKPVGYKYSSNRFEYPIN